MLLAPSVFGGAAGAAHDFLWENNERRGRG